MLKKVTRSSTSNIEERGKWCSCITECFLQYIFVINLSASDGVFGMESIGKLIM